MRHDVIINEQIKVGSGRPFLLLAGPCVLESEELANLVAGEMAEICARLGISYVFKSSFDKANRTSLDSFRGPGLVDGLRILAGIRQRGIAVVSDVHEVSQVEAAAQVLDIIQIPAFLCRQTDLLVAVARSGKAITLKKGQFMAPWDMKYAVGKIKESGNNNLMLMERGSCF
ncbi:MAG: 3-deoxy-8-phosphooctulonate synthase, partial [Deltaproteobacteria bacterium]|nr:3-deoxy-8-phosphooctulonate synthase [Deltaproteobacteria bacterium]